MDESPTGPDEFVREGFAGQRMLVVPRPAVERALSHPVTGKLFVTDAGFFPHASRHGRERPVGAAEHVLLVCTDGSGWCTTGGATVPVGRGDAVLLRGARIHGGHHSVLIRDGMIEALDVDAAAGAETVDLGGGGACVLPGFTDAHVHFPSWASTRQVRRWRQPA